MGKFSDIPKMVEEALGKMTDKSQLRVLGEESKKLIQKRTRLGGGVTGHLGSRTQLKKLSPSYKKQRKRLKGADRLSSTTTPAKSNLTRTGLMLRDIGVKISRNKVLLRFISPDAKKRAKWVQDAGRTFFFVSKPEFKQLQKNIQKRVQNILNKIK